MQKLIKLSDTHYIVVDDSEIKEGDTYVVPHNIEGKILSNKKIIGSTSN